MRHHNLIPSLLALVLGASASNTAMAHGGLYARAGLGLGFYNVSFDASDDTGLEGLMVPVEVLLGGSLVPGLVVGGAVSFDYAPAPSGQAGGIELKVDISQFLLALAPFVAWYPDPDGGWHVQARAAWGRLETSAQEASLDGEDPSGVVVSAGGGYDVWVSDTLGIGGLVRLTYAPLAHEDLSYSTVAVNLLASLTYY